MRPVRSLLSPLVIALLGERTFQFEGRALRYLYHRYNATWSCERCVEVPIIRSEIAAVMGKKILEVGNVLSHYYECGHQIVDKYERSPSVINADVNDYRPAERYDLIISISTFEHIGFDDPEQNQPRAIRRAIQHSRSLLSSGGRLVLSMPIGYNPEADGVIQTETLGLAKVKFMQRTSYASWSECSKHEAFKRPFGSRFPYANAISIAVFGAA